MHIFLKYFFIWDIERDRLSWVPIAGITQLPFRVRIPEYICCYFFIFCVFVLMVLCSTQMFDDSLAVHVRHFSEYLHYS